MKYITFSLLGIHFVNTEIGQINAHWSDFFGIGIHRTIKHHFLISILRFWESLYEGICFLITDKFEYGLPLWQRIIK